jgi:hypothetical protein
MFCNLMDIIKYQPLSDPNDPGNFKFDYYVQNFYFSIYKKLSSFDLITDDDGTVYISTKDAKNFMKIVLFFTD